MNQLERRLYLINHLLNERNETIDMPHDTYNQKRLLRGLMNVRMPDTISKEFIDIQNDYLQEELKEKGITSFRFRRSTVGSFIYGREILQHLNVMQL